MKAMVHTRYGSPDFLELRDVDKPEPEDDQVLVEVRAASINEWDWGRLMARPFVNRVMFGLLRPRRKNRILGCDISGRVEAIGSEIERFRPGDEVFGDLSGCGWGGFAEYVCAPEYVLALKSASMTFEQASAMPQAGLLALQGLLKGHIARGRRVLVNGAGGGVGTFAIQIAKSFGTEVTGVDSAEKLEAMRSVGADHVIDYTREDFTESGQTYDLILDVMARRSLSDYRRSLSRNGTCILVGGSTSVILKAVLFGGRGNKKIRLLLHHPNPDELVYLNELFESGEVAPVVDGVYTLSELPGALRYYAEGHHKGKVVISMADTI